MATKALDIDTQSLYSSYTYDYIMEFQKTLLSISNPSDSDSASSVVGTPLNQGAKKPTAKKRRSSHSRRR